jgi:hypothetical protein
MHEKGGAGFLNKLMIAAPFFLVAAWGVRQNVSHETFTFVACSSEDNANISAYAPIVKATKAAEGKMSYSAGAARALAYRWLDGAQDGLLKPLQPVAYEDTTRDGVKNEIMNSNIEVSEALDKVAEEERLHHKWDQSAKDALLGATVVDVTKYFDFSSLAVCSMVQRRALNTVQKEWTQLSPTVKVQVTKEALALRANDDRLYQMAIKARSELLKYELRRGYDVRRIAKTEDSIKLTELQEPASTIIHDFRAKAIASDEPGEPDFFVQVSLGYVSALDTDKRITKLVNPI